MASDQNKDFLISLGYDPTEAKKGLEKSAEDLSNFKVKAVQLSAELTQTQNALTQQYTAASIKSSQERAAAIAKEIQETQSAYAKASADEQVLLAQKIRDLNDEYLAQRKIINGYADEIEHINQLKAGYSELQTQIKQTNAARAVLRPQAQGQGGILEKSLGSINVGEIFQATGILGLGASIPFALHDIGKSIKETVMGMGEFAESMSLASQKTGLTVRELQEFDAAGRSVGLTTEDMVTAMRKFSEGIVGAAQAQKQGSFDGLNEAAVKSAKLFQALGISAVDAAGNTKSTKEIFIQLADAFEKLPEGATKARVAVELLGKSGLNMIPFLSQGSKGIQEIIANMDGLFPELTKTAEAFDAVRMSQAEYEAASQSLKTSLAEGVLPVMAKLIEGVAVLMGQMSDKGTIQAFGDALRQSLNISPDFESGQAEENSLVSMLSGKKSTVDHDEFQAREKQFQNPVVRRGKVFGQPVPGDEDYDPGITEGQKQLAAAKAEFSKRYPKADAESPTSTTTKMLAALSLILEKRVQIVEAAKAETAEQKKLGDEVQKILTEQNSRGDAAKQKELERARQTIGRTEAEGQTRLADARDSLVLPPQMLARNEIQGNQRQLDELRSAAAGGLKDDGLLENLRQQNELVKKIYELKVKIVEEDKKDVATLKEATERANEAMAREAESWAKKFAEPGTYFATGIAPIKPPASVTGGVSSDIFKQQFDRVTAEKQIGAITPEKELAGLASILTGLKEEIAARLQSKDIVGKQLEQLQQMSELVKKIVEETKASSKETGLGIFLSDLKESTELVSRFSEVFKKTNVPKYAVGIDAASNLVGMAEKKGVEAYGGSAQYGAPDFGALLKGMQVIFKEFGKDFGEIIKPLAGALQGSPIASGAAAGASIAATGTSLAAGLSKSLSGVMAANPIIGSLIGIGGGLLGGLFGASQKNMEAEVTRIRNDINESLDDLRAGLQGAGATLAELEAQRAKAVADLSGQKGGNKQLQSLLPGLDQQIADLQGQIKKQVDDFRKTTAELSVPEAAGRQTIDQIAQIAAALTQASLAGASAVDQVKYLNAAFADLAVTVHNDLNTEEQTTLDLLQKEIDLQTQKTNLINTAYAQQRQVQDSLALSRAYTPAQSAALQIREIGIQRDQQLQLLDNQDQLLKAQIDGQAQLFGWTLKDLQSADAKTKLLQQQVDLQKQITAQVVSQITANQAFLTALQNGLIPVLPAGLLPSNFPGWTPGSSFSPTAPPSAGTPPIQIIINAPGGNPKAIVDAINQGIRNTNTGRQLGFQ